MTHFFGEIRPLAKVLSRSLYSNIFEDYRKFGLKPRRFTTALSYNGKSDNQAKN
ncbi:MAG: hypothetical protein GPJ09_04725 [Microcystis aeruginosa SX13-01]|jgi:hypothetical protein|nr:hypothetical protein [Microcystis aeruginosa SX13-01]NCR57298.1 hypothetical protein [Microcystis aeruginosa LL13-06]NCT51209.1 hypothetical protein [Microcystis aeruginosa G13-03]